MKQKFGYLAMIAAALMVPSSILAGAVTEFILKQGNSNQIDITNGLAYLRPILQVGIGVGAAFAVASIVLAVVSFKKDESRQAAELALALLLAITLLSVGAGVLKNKTDQLEKIYTEQRLDTFFKDLSR